MRLQQNETAGRTGPGDNLSHLSKEELAFYDALGVNDSTVQVSGDEVLRDIAQLSLFLRASSRQFQPGDETSVAKVKWVASEVLLQEYRCLEVLHNSWIRSSLKFFVLKFR